MIWSSAVNLFLLSSGINTIAAAKRDLSSDFKKLKNEVLVNLQHLVENLGAKKKDFLSILVGLPRAYWRRLERAR